MRQEAPDPGLLEDLVGRVRYREREGWRFSLRDMDRGQGSAGLTLVILRVGPDTYHPESRIAVNHFFIVPAAAYNYRSWQRWLFERIRDVETHESAEEFTLVQDDGSLLRPYAPLHGPGWDPYLIAELAADEDRRTSFRGDLSPVSP